MFIICMSIHMYVQVKIYREFYHSVIYTANECRHVTIYYYFNTKLNKPHMREIYNTNTVVLSYKAIPAAMKKITLIEGGIS
jgi:hypothetical protein